ncbi:MAG: 2Fe-2S iron-sulfur cluster binding domain-containing protein [Emcibacter sp.]|nr:2Fe-2S iron-sulfur cluster binding domain-containing protein [Emcibacter sp.]
MSYELTIEPIGEVIEVEEGQTILDACLRAGIYIPYQCNHGLCSTCKIEVIEGDVDLGDASAFALMDFERDEGKVLACTCTLESDVVIEADIEEDDDAEYLPITDFTGVVTEITDVTPDVKKIIISVGDDVEFQAGQYIQLAIPGVEGSRAFSIANSPGDADHVELHIRLVPDGKGTTYVHQNLSVDDKLSFSAPYGHFFVRKSHEKPMIFIAGGTGLSSPKSMIDELLAEGYSKKLTLFHGVRTKADLYYQDYFKALAAKHDNFAYIPALSEKTDGEDWDGEVGFVHEAAERYFDGSFAGHQAYLCGPPPMIEASIRALMKGRLFENDIYCEKFLSKADGTGDKRSPLFKRI